MKLFSQPSQKIMTIFHQVILTILPVNYGLPLIQQYRTLLVKMLIVISVINGSI